MKISELYPCATCCFFHPDERGYMPGSGQCRAKAPTSAPNTHGKLFTVWPLVRDTMGCGDHATVETAPTPHIT